jgi:DHA2 family multidrug resistance protein
MAQASGLSNVIRQVGGSFGVAILSTVLTSRVVFHSQLFGEALQVNSPAFQQVMQHIGGYVSGALGSVGSLADSQSRAILLSHLNKQAFIQGIDDDFLLAAIFTCISIIPVFLLKGKKRKPATAIPLKQEKK